MNDKVIEVQFATNNKICAIVLGFPLDGEGQEGMTRKKRKAIVDKVAAGVILQAVLENLKRLV